MFLLFYLLIVLKVGGCTDDQIVYTKTVGVGDDVKLTCKSKSLKSLFWIRLVSGKLPEVLGRSFSFHSADPRIKTSEEPGAFSLRIQRTKLSDTGIYCCVTTEENLIFLSRTDLRVAGSTSGISAVSPSDPVSPTHSVPLQYSVLSDSNNKICPEDRSAYLFKCRSDESQPNFNNIQGFSVEEDEKNSEGLSMKNCIFSFFKNISSSDVGNCYCAVATCGEVVCGNRTVDIEGSLMWSQTSIGGFALLCALLAVSLIVIAFLIYVIKSTPSLQEDCGGQRDNEILVYSAVVFTMMKADSGGIKDSKAAEMERICNAVKAFGLDN